MHDRDAEVRRSAFAAGQLLTHDSESAAALRGALSGAARNETLAVTQRLAALDALSDLRDGQAIPSISRLLLDSNPSIVATARQALSTLTCRDFGHDIEAWTHWWSRNGHRHRVEWLIDALLDDSAPLRQSAAEELRTISRLYVGHYDDNVIEERARIQERYRQWWETTGRAVLSPEQS
jgi:HEAT repeat protein